MAKFDFGSLSDELDPTPAVEGEQPVTEEAVVEEEQQGVAEEEVPALEEEEEEEVVYVDEDGNIVEEEVEVKPKAKAQYTPEEIQEILANDGDIDTTRLSPAEQATMKAMQRAFTPKLQEAAELRKEMEKLRSELQPKTQEEPKDIYEAFDRDPKEVMGYVDSQIAELATNPTENIAQIEQLRSLKFEFQQRAINNIQKQGSQQADMQKHVQAMLEAVPDLPAKQEALKDFAINYMGYTLEELAHETNPSVVGQHAVNTVKRINAAYNKLHAKTTVKKKKVVKRASTVEKPSVGGFESKDTPEIESIKKEALKSKNFKAYFAALEED